jgi:hypothetical protein
MGTHQQCRLIQIVNLGIFFYSGKTTAFGFPVNTLLEWLSVGCSTVYIIQACVQGSWRVKKLIYTSIGTPTGKS